jgi:hypothetical protein
MKNSERIPSQAAIGRALGLSPASMTKYKKMGMPVGSIEAAYAWRLSHVKPTAHTMVSKPVEVCSTAQGSQVCLMTHALGLLFKAASELEAGRSIDVMIPHLRAALRAVPVAERDGDALFPVKVMDILTADVYQRAQEEGGIASSSDGQGMTDEEAEWMGDFWYRVAAGEVRLA